MLDHARWILKDSGSKASAAAWMTMVYEAIDRLADLPGAHALAEEDRHRGFEIRKLAVHGITILFHVDDTRQEVRVLGARGSTQCPEPGALPNTVLPWQR